MAPCEPTAELDPRFRDPNATPTPWAVAREQLFVFHVRAGTLWIEGSEDPRLASEVRPTKAFGFGKGDTFSQTRWQFRSN